MNGSAPKTRRRTKGGSLPRSSAVGLSRSPGNNGNGASTVAVPIFRSLIEEFFSMQRYARDRNGLEATRVDASDLRSTKSCSVTDVPSLNSAARRVETKNMGESVVQFPRWKRVLDLVLVLATSPVWLPLMTFVMILIKIGSRGPIFYRQERVGYKRKLFMIFKFRSMKVNAETGSHERHLATLIDDNSPMTKLDTTGDPRLLPLGRLLRATGLDELPQIFNVIRGEMSLVGPRPCLPYEFQRYERWQQERVNAAPGLTGYWQVNGKNKTTFAEMIDMDIFYSKNMSLGLDLAIMLKTIPAIIQQVREAHTRTRMPDVASPSVHRNSVALASDGGSGSANL
jgi:lipopolysaccharide/colanic/teichoic acid biosynthesis glycosyltransferase